MRNFVFVCLMAFIVVSLNLIVHFDFVLYCILLVIIVSSSIYYFVIPDKNFYVSNDDEVSGVIIANEFSMHFHHDGKKMHVLLSRGGGDAPKVREIESKNLHIESYQDGRVLITGKDMEPALLDPTTIGRKNG